MELTLDRLAEGIRVAQANGDTAMVRRLGEAFRRLQSEQQPAPSEASSGYLAAAAQSVDNAAGLLGGGLISGGELTGIDMLGSVGGAISQWAEDRSEARNYQRPENAEGIGKNIREGEYSDALRSVPYSVLENAAQLAPGAVASLPYVGVPARVLGLGLTAGMALGEQRSEAEDKGLDPTASWQDALAAGAATALEVLPGGGATGGLIRTFAREGLQEVAQEGVTVANTATKGADYTGTELFDRGVDSFVTGGVIGAGADGTVTVANQVRDGVQEATNRLRYDSGFDSDDARVAQTILDAADGDMGVLRNVSDTTANDSAQGAAKGALGRLRDELRLRTSALERLAKEQGNDELVDIINNINREADQSTQDQTDPLMSLLGIVRSPSKVSQNHKATTSNHSLNRLLNAFPDVVEAQEAASLARQIKKLKPFTESGGDLGGLSRFTKNADILDGRNTGLAKSLLGVGGVAAAGVGGLKGLAIGTTINRMARGIDVATNSRSRIKRYVESVQRENPDIVPFQGDNVRDLINDSRADAAQLKLFQDAISKKQTNQNREDKARWAREDKAFEKAQKAKTTEQRTQQQAALNQSKAEDQAYVERLTAESLRPGWEAGSNRPDTPAHTPWKVIEHFTGMPIQKFVEHVREAESQGIAKPGTADRVKNNPRSFMKGSKVNQEMYALQDWVRANYNSEYVPGPLQDSDIQSEKALRRLEATDGRPTGSRRKEKAWEGARRRRNLNAEIDKARGSLKSGELIALHGLAETIDSPTMTRDMRMELVDRELRKIFPRSRAAVEFWRKQFGPLAQIGNDYVIDNRAEAEQAKEEAFEKKIEKVKKAKRKPKKDRKSSAPETPSVEKQPEPAQQPQTRADRALAKLNEPDALPPPEVEEAVSTGDSVADAKQPRATKRKGRNSLAGQLEAELESIAYKKTVAEQGAESLASYMADLPPNVTGRIEGLILRGATDMITQNNLTEAYDNLIQPPLPPHVIAQEVERGLAQMENDGLIRRVLKTGQTELVVDGKYKKDAEGKNLKVVHIEVVDPELMAYLDIAKSVEFMARQVSQETPETPYAPGNLTEGPHRAFKDYDDSQIDGTFKPALDFLNDLRSQKLSIHPMILDQIEASINGTGDRRVGTIAEVLTPKKGAIKPKRDSSPLRTVAQLISMLGDADSRVTTQFRQEASFGANLRVYMKNGLASTQSGDIMKGLTRMGEKSSIGSVQGIDMMLHTFGNILGKDKASPEARRNAIFEDGVIENLLKFAEDPFGRNKLARDGKQNDLGKLVENSEGFFQALNVAHEVTDMVNFAKARHPRKAKMGPRELLMDPKVKEDLAKNYQSNYIVQLDASNNAYQLMGLTIGYRKMLQATGMIPKDGVNNFDTEAPADIYTDPAIAVADRIPELKSLNLPASKLRKVFKGSIGTFLYEAEYNSRKENLAESLADVTKRARISGFNPDEAIFTVPPEMQEGMMSEAGFTFNEVSYDVQGNAKTPTAVRKRVKPVQVNVKSYDKKAKKTSESVETRYVIEAAGPKGKWQERGKKYKTAEDAIANAHESDILVRMNRELVREINVQYPRIQEYLRFSKVVSEIAKSRNAKSVNVPTPDGMMLQTSFDDDFEYESIPVQAAQAVVPMGYKGSQSKLTGRGVAAFMMHQLDAYVLREVHKRMKAEGLLKTGFNPIHDSFGFAPADAKRGQEIWAEVMQELGREDYNIFLQVLETNGISLSEFVQAGGTLPAREGVKPQPQSNIPTALS